MSLNKKFFSVLILCLNLSSVPFQPQNNEESLLLVSICEAKKRMFWMSLFLIGKDITELLTISEHSFGFNPFYSEGRIKVLYHQNLLSTIKEQVKASYNNVLYKYF